MNGACILKSILIPSLWDSLQQASITLHFVSVQGCGLQAKPSTKTTSAVNKHVGPLTECWAPVQRRDQVHYPDHNPSPNPNPNCSERPRLSCCSEGPRLSYCSERPRLSCCSERPRLSCCSERPRLSCCEIHLGPDNAPDPATLTMKRWAVSD